MKTFFKFCLLITLFYCGFVVLALSVSADTIVNYDISSDTHWTTDGSPYLIYADSKQDLTVVQNATLTIDPGVTVKFNLDTGLNIRGQLIAHGNSDTPITFTSIYDNGGSIGSAYPGDWYGIVVKGADSVLKHVHIKYAGRDGFIGYDKPFSLYLSGYNTHFTNSIVEDGYGNGVWLDYFYYGLVHNNVIRNHEENGVVISHSYVDMYNNAIQGNGKNGISLEDRSQANFSHRKVNIHSNSIQWNEGSGIYMNTLLAPEIHDNEVSYNGTGINVQTGYPRIHHNNILDNYIGVKVKMNWPLVISNNNFENNESYDIQVESFADYSGVIAEDNWWGSDEPSVGDEITTGVNADSWLYEAAEIIN
ncbi:right-handed parallel beta-helix repeat-containing protein [Patescibacteria group bacterium]|nr:right-handed parallel beta-helix repeat-containing protein [Patescibacteria group bacterium]MBU1683158.1 right-handed parallel beta-helix repeat-containing protein [Patescibacteria group bacterium]MBU1934521.1 right-handed parallel beta-helix repeat-containing protein [Patescibacteria group bacterium]